MMVGRHLEFKCVVVSRTFARLLQAGKGNVVPSRWLATAPRPVSHHQPGLGIHEVDGARRHAAEMLTRASLDRVVFVGLIGGAARTVRSSESAAFIAARSIALLCATEEAIDGDAVC